MWTAETNTDYTAQSTGRRMRFYYQRELQCELTIGKQKDQRAVLEYWAHLKIPPERVLPIYEALTGFVGYKMRDVSMTEDGVTCLVGGRPVN